MAKNGYDRYLDYQYSKSGNFFRALFYAIRTADPINLLNLQKGFPEETAAYVAFTQGSLEDFYAQCTPGNPLIQRMRDENIADSVKFWMIDE